VQAIDEAGPCAGRNSTRGTEGPESARMSGIVDGFGGVDLISTRLILPRVYRIRPDDERAGVMVIADHRWPYPTARAAHQRELLVNVLRKSAFLDGATVQRFSKQK